LLLALLVRVDSSDEQRFGQSWCFHRQVVGYLNSPQSAAHIREFGFFRDAFVPQKFGPGPIRRFRTILNGSFANAMPAGGWLAGTLPEKWKARVCMSIDNHVAGDATNARARS